MKMYPVFKICKVEGKPKAQILSGTVDRTIHGKDKWVSDKNACALFKGQVFVFGRWYKRGELWQFKVNKEDIGRLNVKKGDCVSVIDYYWGERAELVLDESIKWEMKKYKSKNEPDHEHCSICWDRITDGEYSTYYLGNNRHPVCIRCYENHVKQKDVSFIPDGTETKPGVLKTG